ncbi:hypothetical protein [Kineococcus esterisolvens]|uniref:hypothetical protein n=1 Tax=unclassified Kineococcus TaxID=2621656 RepID=UPI003D7DD5E2
MTKAWELYEERGQYTVVGQMYYSPEHRWLDPADAQAAKVALGRYATEGQARKDAESLVIGGATGEEFRTWVLPVWNGTPATYFAHRLQERKRQAMKANGPAEEAELERRIQWFKDHPDALHYRPDGPARCDCDSYTA